MPLWDFLIRHILTRRVVQGFVVVSLGAVSTYVYFARIREIHPSSEHEDQESVEFSSPHFFLERGILYPSSTYVLQRVTQQLQRELLLAMIEHNTRNVEVLQEAEGIMQNVLRRVEESERGRPTSLQNIVPERVDSTVSPTEMVLQSAANMLEKHATQPVPSTSASVSKESVATQRYIYQRTIGCQTLASLEPQAALLRARDELGVFVANMQLAREEALLEEALGIRQPAEGASTAVSQDASMQTEEVLDFFDRTIDEVDVELSEDLELLPRASGGSTPVTDTESLLERRRGPAVGCSNREVAQNPPVPNNTRQQDDSDTDNSESLPNDDA